MTSKEKDGGSLLSRDRCHNKYTFSCRLGRPMWSRKKGHRFLANNVNIYVYVASKKINNKSFLF